MTLSVIVLERGGCSVHGGAWWNPRDGGFVQLHVMPEDQYVDVAIQYPSTVSTTEVEENGINGSAPSISGSTVSLQFQGLTPGGSYRIDATFASGEKRRVTFLAHDAQTWTATGALDPEDDDDDVDDGAWG